MSLLLSDTLVVCDMDNTLLTAKEGLPACNRTVIQLFTEMGGLFTVATGRPPESIRAALPGITLSSPAISCNGALLYDFSNNTVLQRSTLNREQATTAILDVREHFPRMGVEVMAGDDVETPIWDEYAKIAEKHGYDAKAVTGTIERFKFYDEARKAYAVIATGESALYANILLQKGVVKD